MTSTKIQAEVFRVETPCSVGAGPCCLTKFSETSASYRKTTWRHNPQDLNLNLHLRENLKTRARMFDNVCNLLAGSLH
jgi:hypothetical protein